MKKILSALLLALVLTLLPVQAFASSMPPEKGTVIVTRYYGEEKTASYTVVVGDAPVTLGVGGYETVDGTMYEFEYYSGGYESITIPAYDGTNEWFKKWGNISEFFQIHKHNYRQCYTRLQHWMGCRCGKIYDKADHIDPAADEDKVCTCGYKFSSNCDLTTLWLKDMNLTQRFDKKVTDYTAAVHTYKEVSETAITATALDSLAKVELPRDLSVKDGKNIFSVTVTAEDKTTTKTYTVTAVKPVKVAGILITSDASTVSAEPKCDLTRRLAAARVPDLLLEEMADLAAADGSTRIQLIPNFSKWGYDRIDVPLDCRVLKDIAANTKADVFIKTHFGTVTIPNAEIAALAEGYEVLTVSIEKEASIVLYADGAEIKELPKAIERDLY